ncbi:MAG: hypothetical protein K0V04_33590 [Deltaproteobacteria bacterium]|nr:hypothetical protein [Deltaproteobacteria bacterium]
MNRLVLLVELHQPDAMGVTVRGVDRVTPRDRTRLGELGTDLAFSDLGVDVDIGTDSLDDDRPVEGSRPGPQSLPRSETTARLPQRRRRRPPLCNP